MKTYKCKNCGELFESEPITQDDLFIFCNPCLFSTGFLQLKPVKEEEIIDNRINKELIK